MGLLRNKGLWIGLGVAWHGIYPALDGGIQQSGFVVLWWVDLGEKYLIQNARLAIGIALRHYLILPTAWGSRRGEVKIFPC